MSEVLIKFRAEVLIEVRLRLGINWFGCTN